MESTEDTSRSPAACDVPAAYAAPAAPREPNRYGDTQNDTPYATAMATLAGGGWQRLCVPGHQASEANAPELAATFGEGTLARDWPMLFSSIDLETGGYSSGAPTPIERAERLAAEAWGASRTWFLTNGASAGNQIACLAARTLGTDIVVQRSMHASAIDGMVLAGLGPHFVTPAVDADLGSSHNVTAADIDDALTAKPAGAAVYVVSPSYFGAVADIAGIAAVAHRHGVPLIVDEAWGPHLGFHPGLPTNAVRNGADLVISSTHKMAGSLTQSAILQLGHGRYAEKLGMAVDRVRGTVQSTSSSSLLMVSLDEARRHLAVDGPRDITRTRGDVARIRAGIETAGRFADAGSRIAASVGTVACDPFKIVIDTAAGGIAGSDAQHLLAHHERIIVEMSTPSAIVLLVGATSRPDVDRILAALHRLPGDGGRVPAPLPLPETGPRALGLREAYFSQTEVVPAERAAGRVSSDSLAAYPPGIPNVTPGEILTRDTVEYLRWAAASPSGHVRGAVDSALSKIRVVAAGA